MDADQELLDRFAIAAMHEVYWSELEKSAEHCWSIAIAMKQARDRICTTAKPAQPDPGPFPAIDSSAIPEKK